ELYQIVRAIRDRQEETDAKLDALSMDVHHAHGEIAGVKDAVKELREGVIFVNRKVADTEYEVNLLKQRKQYSFWLKRSERTASSNKSSQIVVKHPLKRTKPLV
ncbi:hypothetical protein, partial [Kitasatospora sp. SC0581]|uniref:hypothetical protein n=1 Tax=Kitasatospora sp. SC0581 TaxID=3394360 RepID=UPI003A84FE0B